jgi:mRNA interferase HigB
MTITHRDRLAQASGRHADLVAALDAWSRVAAAAEWRSFRDLRETYAHADQVRSDDGRAVVVFNIRGNHYRLVAAVSYELRVVNVLKVMKHAEYSRQKWKQTL